MTVAVARTEHPDTNPAGVPTSPSGVPRIDPSIMSVEQAAEVVTDALRDFVGLIVDGADPANEAAAQNLAVNALLLIDELGRVVVRLRQQPGRLARFRGTLIRIGVRS